MELKKKLGVPSEKVGVILLNEYMRTRTSKQPTYPEVIQHIRERERLSRLLLTDEKAIAIRRALEMLA